MSLKAIFNAVKTETVAIKAIDSYLVSLNAKDDDRARNVNAPSQAGGCLRANYYSRTGVPSDGTIDARSRRIFNNGDHVHDRLQEYLEKSGILLMREVPVINDEHEVQGHTDGIIKLNVFDLGVLEIKSINDNGFTQLKDAKPEHKKQAMIYLFSLEERRKYLKAAFKNKGSFKLSAKARIAYYEQKYSYFQDGSKFTKAEKIKMQVDLGMKADEILYNCPSPINKVVFLYENKNNQELKEFVVQRDDAIVEEVLSEYDFLNDCVKNGALPERTCPNKSCQDAKWCNYKIECFL